MQIKMENTDPVCVEWIGLIYADIKMKIRHRFDN